MNIYKPVENKALTDIEKIAMVYGDQRISYGEFLDNVDRIAAGLNALGLEKGDRIALLMHNSSDFVFCFYAAMKLGLVCVSLNIMFKEDEVNYILGDCKPKVMIANKPYLTFLDNIEKYKDGSMKVISIGDDSNPEGVLAFRDFLKKPEQEILTMDLGKDDIAVIGYTSGTTGFPKGAAHTHENVLAHLDGITSHLGYNSTDVVLGALPFFQLVAYITHACVAFHVGGTFIIHEKFEPVDFIETIKKEKVTYFSGVPTIYQMIYSMSQEMDVDFSSVRFGICAGSPLSLSLREKFESTFKFRIMHCYGMTEISLIAACEALNAPTKGVSVGHVLPYIRVRLVKEDGAPGGIGEEGEIQIGSERSLKFYWNKPAETKEALEGGWFRTGDVGRFDNEGHLHIVDRKKDMIIRGGFNVYPVELERVLLQDPRIQEAVVIGIPHERLGEVPRAYVVPEKGAVISEDDVLEISRTKTANYKAIEEVEIVDAEFFPRTALGKVMKVNLKKNI
ncbi:MAG: AMP-binding protein [Desulfobacterales bacterium]|jgi:long-chain acyl-CoA synthetase|nr:AMP-binding protein [Desulfobacteraceae bacterium]MBT7086499.1 AMP-binding protein [Desulfobacterales bacterium]MBT7697574.1 AMP-binding protein [Desulfobacterales bacterium]